MFKMKLLPHWCLTDTRPAFYDTESATAIGQTAKLYGAMNKLIESYNAWIDEVNKTITEFNNETDQDIECFKRAITELCNNYIATMDMKIEHQDRQIEETIVYMKENIFTTVKTIIDEMKESGELDEAILASFETVNQKVIELESLITSEVEKIFLLQQDNINNKQDIETNKTNIEALKDKVNALYFDNVAAMKNSTKLNSGDIVQTLGYYEVNDGGAAIYKIRDQKATDVEDGGLIHLLNKGLVAELIIENNTIIPEQFGCYGNNENDDTIQLQKALDSGFKVLCKGLYKISSNINIKNDIDMEGDSYIVANENITDVFVSISSDKQRIGRNININVDGNGFPDTCVAVGGIRKSKINVKIINAGRVGLDCDHYDFGSISANFNVHVVGNKQGTTEIGVLVNGFDLTFEDIVTQDCKYGVYLHSGQLIANSLHSWLSNEVAPILWNESYVLYDKNFSRFIINWLYQDSVKYGVGGIGPYGHINLFEYFNTLKDASTLYDDYLNVYVNEGATRFTIDRFVNAKKENYLLKYELVENANHEFGVLNKNGVPSTINEVSNYLPFNDVNLAPQWGGFNCKYNFANLPVEVGGQLKCEIIGSCVIQTYYPNNYSENPKYWVRFRKIGESTWSAWSKYSPVTE